MRISDWSSDVCSSDLAKRKATGKKPGGKPPTPPTAGPRADDQINLTDADSRIMKTSGGGFEQCYNGQAVVDSESMLILAPHLTRSEEHTSELQSLMRISYAVFCLKKKKTQKSQSDNRLS